MVCCRVHFEMKQPDPLLLCIYAHTSLLDVGRHIIFFLPNSVCGCAWATPNKNDTRIFHNKELMLCRFCSQLRGTMQCNKVSGSHERDYTLVRRSFTLGGCKLLSLFPTPHFPRRAQKSRTNILLQMQPPDGDFFTCADFRPAGSFWKTRHSDAFVSDV